VKEALNADLRTTGSILQKTLKRTRIGIPISPDHLASLYITKNSSELDVQFDNSYLSFMCKNADIGDYTSKITRI